MHLTNTRKKQLSLISILLLILLLWTHSHHQRAQSSLHPIIHLLTQASLTASLIQSSQSTTLLQAYTTYQKTHARDPPPGYDQWFKLAIQHQTCRIDGFEDMYQSLKIWWGVDPKEIRGRMEQLSPVRGMGRVRVEKGGKLVDWKELEMERKGSGGEDSDARRAVFDILGKIKEEWGVVLPEFDMFVNGYDEPRLSIPYELKTELEQLEKARRVRPVVDEPLELRSFGGSISLFDKVRQTCPTSSTCPTAYSTLVQTCPPQSLSRTAPLLSNPGSNPIITQSFSYPFTTPIGHFLTSPKLEQDTWCDQPDLQELHAAYIHPLSLTYTNQPYPVFGNSRIGGFDDILVPSWWYWFRVSPFEDVVKWEEKKDNVFWRGSNTGGFSIGTNFRGWLRSRFVALSNPSTSLSSDEEESTTVVLADQDDKTLIKSIPIHNLTSTHLDIAFIAPDQGDPSSISLQHSSSNFRFTSRVPFEENFNSKAILDMDGTAYSGRFLTLMQSRSTVWKAHSFREAVEHSLIPWFHYVPVSIRGEELYSLVGFFFGAEEGGEEENGVEKGGRWSRDKRKRRRRVKGHDEELKKIGEQGREWAGKCARREDQMLYLYLLVLEWARLVRDDRTELGFRP